MPSQPSSGVVKAIVWACLSSWYYGYHITELNYPVNGLMCHPTPADESQLLPPCLGLDKFRYSAVTSLLTAGGLAGSLLSDRLVRAEGIAGAIAWTGWLNLASAVLMAAAPHWLVLALGRTIAGLACGLAVCLVPPYLASLARSVPELSSKSGQIGTLHQLAIVLGICCSQSLGLLLTGPHGDKPGAWRWVCALSGVASIVQIAMAGQPPIFESNVDPEDPDERGPSSPMSASHEEAGAPLLRPRAGPSVSEQLSVRALLSTPSLRRPVILVTSMMCFQQLSGVNAVLFYSNGILMSIMPNAGAGMLSVGVTVVNALMTLPAIFLVDRLGRRTLLLVSAIGMGFMSILLAQGLDNHKGALSSFAMVTFIAAFAVGLGPVPFLLVSEMVPPHAVPALSSLALSASWITTFIVGAVFLPLRDLLAYPSDPSDPYSDFEGEGRVFYVFAGMLALATLVILRGVPK